MTPDQISRLRELAQLRDEGILTEAEFTAKKAQMLGSVVPTGVPSNAPAPSASSTMGSRGMGFGEAISTGFSKYVDFSGRATRSEYWFWSLFTMLTGWVTMGIDVGFGLGAGGIGVVNTLFSLATLLPNIAVVLRRLHDTGRSGWWYCIIFTCIGIIPLLIWLCEKSEEDTNAYGPNPFTVPPLNEG